MAYKPTESYEAANQQYQQALGRYQQLVNRKRSIEGGWAQYGLQKQMADEAKMERGYKQRAFKSQREEDLNWGDETAKYGAMGGAAAGPWGALVGAAVGSTLGVGRSIKRRYSDKQKARNKRGHGKNDFLDKMSDMVSANVDGAKDVKRAIPKTEFLDAFGGQTAGNIAKSRKSNEELGIDLEARERAELEMAGDGGQTASETYYSSPESTQRTDDAMASFKRTALADSYKKTAQDPKSALDYNENYGPKKRRYR